MKIDKSLNLTHKQLFDLSLEQRKEIFAKLPTNTYVCFAEAHPDFKYPFDIDKFPCVVNGCILY